MHKKVSCTLLACYTCKVNIYCRFHFLYLNSRGLLSMYVTHWCLCCISFPFWLSHIDVAVAFKRSKLNYFSFKNFRTTKSAVRNQNIQIYHISQVTMAYCLVMIMWLPSIDQMSCSHVCHLHQNIVLLDKMLYFVVFMQ